jgi:hypothetical protein
LLSLLLSIVKAAAFPFDRVLTAMVDVGLCAEALCRFLGLTRVLLEAHIVRLGLRTPCDRPFREPGSRGWSVADTQQVIALRTACVHPEVIGQTLSKPRSANAVRAKCRRLGLQPPPRKALFRPDAAQSAALGLRLPFGPESTAPAEICGRIAGPVQPLGAAPPAPGPYKARGYHPAPDRPEGQGELPLSGMAGADAPPPAAPRIPVTVAPIGVPAPAVEARPAVPAAEAAQPAPSSIADVDFADLSWFARLRTPLSNEVAAWTVGMLFMSGANRFRIAGMLGKTEAALRTMRTRMRVPVDPERSKASDVFDLEVAAVTRERGKWIIRKEPAKDGLPKFFWVKQGDRTNFFSPAGRTRDHMIEGRYPTMCIITRAMLDAEKRAQAQPTSEIASSFATEGRQARISKPAGDRCETKRPPSLSDCPTPTSRAGSSADVLA